MRTIEVFANPYIALDKDGVPQGVVAMPGARRSYVGAQLDVALSQKVGKPRFYYPLGRSGDGKVKVHFTTEIVHSVLAGELIAADAKSAHLCGVRKDFLEPEKALEREKARAAEYYQHLLGDPGAQLQDIPREPTKFDSELEAEAEAAASPAASPKPTAKPTPTTKSSEPAPLPGTPVSPTVSLITNAKES